MKLLMACLLGVGSAAASHGAAQAQTAVTTYHYDTLRSGWNASETTLTAANASQLQLQQSVALDEQVDAQPLLVPGVNLGNQGTHDVLYVVTENNSVYGLDAATGAVLLHTNLGAPVPQDNLPGACDNNGPNVGITSTPVIDAARATLYLIAYSRVGGANTYTLHALSLTTLADTLAPRTITAVHKLTGGTTYSFNAAVMRQRPGLLLSGGNIYAGFGSFCDSAGNQSRGWVLGWNETTLAPLPVRDLQDQQATAPDGEFLTAIWMSGYGLAADAAGSIYFATANSDPSGKSWNKRRNLSESVVKLSGDLSTLQGFFTPTGKIYGQVVDDMRDGDLGAGGVLLLPDQPGSVPHLAVASGKLSPNFLLNRDALGGRDGQLQRFQSFGCWCGPSSFTGADGHTDIVTSTGQAVIIFRLRTTPKTSLQKIINTANLSTGQDGGFFTTISSNATKAGTAVVWALSRPTDNNPANVLLYAFDPTTGAQLTSLVAGTWPNTSGDADLVPVVANGRIYVASYKQLTIFALGQPAHAVAVAAPRPPAAHAMAGAPHSLTGMVMGVNGARMMLRLRSGQIVAVDLDPARRAYAVAVPVEGQAARVRGDWSGDLFRARVVLHAKQAAALWVEDQ